MQLSAPKNTTFYAGLILWVVGLLALFIPSLNEFPMGGLASGYVFAILGGLILILGNVLKGI